jgi:quinol monooxygenase YgiN
MGEPVVYVSTWRIREGKLEEYRRFLAELVTIVDENEPGIPAFLTFANEDGSEITNVHVFPDTATLDRHMQVLGERVGLLPDDLTAVMAYLEPVHIQVFGTPGGPAAEMDRGLRDGGAPFTVRERFLAGFTRGQS